jgi:hypothetical protein
MVATKMENHRATMLVTTAKTTPKSRNAHTKTRGYFDRSPLKPAKTGGRNSHDGGGVFDRFFDFFEIVGLGGDVGKGRFRRRVRR